MVGCRPEHLEILPAGQGHGTANVRVKEQLGGESLLYLDMAGGAQIVAKVDGDDRTEIGTEVGISIPTHRLHQFDAAGRAL